MDLNKVFILGRMTADAEQRFTPSGMSVSSFSVATTRKWTDKAKVKQEQTEFHNIIAWGQNADFASKYFKKGDTVLIEGRLQTRKWTDKQGAERKTTEIMADNVQGQPRAKSGQERPTEEPLIDLNG